MKQTSKLLMAAGLQGLTRRQEIINSIIANIYATLSPWYSGRGKTWRKSTGLLRQGLEW